MQLPKTRQISTSNDTKVQEWLTEIWANSPALEGNVSMTLRTALAEMYARSVTTKHQTPIQPSGGAPMDTPEGWDESDNDLPA